MITIPVVTERCAGIDVGKRGLAIAVLTGPADKEAAIQTRWLGTTNSELEALKQWLLQEGVTTVAMESTGSYWIPVKNVLEKDLKILLVCAKKHHPKKGDKTDFRDAIHVAHLHRHGMLTGSYLPERSVVEQRDLTRRRKKLQGNLASEKNRIQKTLEVANVKIGNVISDVFGVSGQEMLDALLSGRQIEPGEIAELAKNRLRSRIPQLTETLQGHLMNNHHRWLIQQSIEHICLLDRQREALEEKIMEGLEPWHRQFELMCTIPGVKDLTAATILAEIGPDMSVFPTSDHLCSWAGICCGNNRSAGKSKGSHIKKANKFLRAALVQAAWGAVRKNGSVFQRKFHRWAKKLGRKKAIIAVSRSLMRVIYTILRGGKPYREPDAGILHELERQKLVRHHARRLRELGAEQEVMEEIVEQLLYPVAPPAEASATELATDAEAEQTPPNTSLHAEQTATPFEENAAVCSARRPAKVCWGKLGFRARSTRNQYSIVKQPPGKRSSTDVPGNHIVKPTKRPQSRKPAKRVNRSSDSPSDSS